MHIELRELPGTPKLFRDYAGGDPRALALFARDPFDTASIAAVAAEVGERDYYRKRLADILVEQNEQWGADEAALANCRRLERDDCLAVVTGQQVGLLGGPLLVLFKALHAVRLAERCERELGRPVVPIFWLELEDHDLDEVNRLTVMDREHGLRKLSLDLGKGGRRPVKDILLGPEIENLLAELENIWPRTGFSRDAFDLLCRCYAPDSSFADGFARLHAALLSRFGLLLADPSHPHLKRRAAPIFTKEISQPSVARQRFIQHEEKILAAGYDKQVETPAGALHLFLEVDGLKYRLAADGERFRLIGADESFEKDELLEIAKREPRRLVPAVLLRPLVQDVLFPTIAYVAGPSEVCYFAQAQPLYESFGVTMPVVIPRAGGTLLGGPARRAAEKYGLEPGEMLQPAEALLKHVLAEHLPPGAGELFASVKREVAEALARLKGELDTGEEGFARAAERAAKKIVYNLDKLEERYVKALQRRNEVVVRRITQLSNAVRPNGSLQERVFPIAQFLNGYGEGIADAVGGAIDPLRPRHDFIPI